MSTYRYVRMLGIAAVFMGSVTGCDSPGNDPGQRAKQRIDEAREEIADAKSDYRASVVQWKERLDGEVEACQEQVAAMIADEHRTSCEASLAKLKEPAGDVTKGLAAFDQKVQQDFDGARLALDASIKQYDALVKQIIQEVRAAQVTQREVYLKRAVASQKQVAEEIKELRQRVVAHPMRGKAEAEMKKLDEASVKVVSAIDAVRESEPKEWRQAVTTLEKRVKAQREAKAALEAWFAAHVVGEEKGGPEKDGPEKDGPEKDGGPEKDSDSPSGDE